MHLTVFILQKEKRKCFPSSTLDIRALCHLGTKEDHNNLEPWALSPMWFEILTSSSYLNNSFQFGGKKSIQCLEYDTVNYLECFILWRIA